MEDQVNQRRLSRCKHKLKQRMKKVQKAILRQVLKSKYGL